MKNGGSWRIMRKLCLISRKIQTLVTELAPKFKKITREAAKRCHAVVSWSIDTAPLILRSRLQNEITRHVNDRFKFLENVETSHGKFHVNSVSRSGAKIQKAYKTNIWMVDVTWDLHNSKFNATFGRGLIQLLRTMRYVFGMHAWFLKFALLAEWKILTIWY